MRRRVELGRAAAAVAAGVCAGLVMFVLTLAVAAVLPAAWGWTPVQIVSGSMEPAIRTGDVVVVADGELSERCPRGRVVTFERDGDLVTHRVVRCTAGKLQTKGDANASPDTQLVARSAVLGEARILVPQLGAHRVHAVVAVAAGGVAGVALWGAAAPAGAPPKRRRLRRPPRGLGLVLVAGVTAAAVLVDQRSAAVFAVQTSNAANSWQTIDTTYATAVTAASPHLYWRLGEGSGTTAVEQVRARNGTYSGTYSLGQVGAVAPDTDTAVQVSGGGRMTVAGHPDLDVTSGPFSVELWIRPAAIPNTSFARGAIRFDGTNVAYLLAFDTAGRKMRFRATTTAGDYTVFDPTDGTAGTWTHYVGVFTGSAAQLWRNGVLVASMAAAGTPKPVAGGTALGVGADPTGTAALNGRVDEVAVYRRALTPTEIADHASYKA